MGFLQVLDKAAVKREKIRAGKEGRKRWGREGRKGRRKRMKKLKKCGENASA